MERRGGGGGGNGGDGVGSRMRRVEAVVPGAGKMAEALWKSDFDSRWEKVRDVSNISLYDARITITQQCGKYCQESDFRQARNSDRNNTHARLRVCAPVKVPPKNSISRGIE